MSVSVTCRQPAEGAQPVNATDQSQSRQQPQPHPRGCGCSSRGAVPARRKGKLAMHYRLAAVPAAWMSATLYIVEDCIGRLFLLDPAENDMQLLDERDANTLMQWYELSHSKAWHLRSDLIRQLSRPASLSL